MLFVKSRSFVCRTMGAASWLLNFLVNLSKEACEYLREDFTSTGIMTVHATLARVSLPVVDLSSHELKLLWQNKENYNTSRVDMQ